MDKAEILKSIGKKIRKVRLEKGLTQLDLVGRIHGDIDVTNISRIEAGRTNPTIFTLYRLADALEVSILDLLKD
ncbi:XRE family transcriptional regulator [Kaistella haifensis]|nr:XRE family transcriptional regulator [Kaistella haifensis]